MLGEVIDAIAAVIGSYRDHKAVFAGIAFTIAVGVALAVLIALDEEW